MQRVPSLNSLILIQGKIAAFIHCFVAVLKVTTLYALEVAICKNEGVGKFEELELGPLLKHPLIVHYFSVNPGVSEVFKITSEEIMSFVSEFMDRNGGTAMKIDELLNFIAEKKSAGSRENLGVRIQSLGMHITFIQQARQFETSAMNKYIHMEKKESSKIIRKHPILSAQKKQLDKNFISASSNSEDASSDDDQDETENIKSSDEPHICMPFGLKAEVEELDQNFISISERITSFSSANGKFCGKNIRFISSDSEDASSDGDQDKTGNFKSSERPSTCPYPSASEEMVRLGLETEVNSSLHTASGSDGYRNDIRQIGNIKSSERPSICPYPPASEEKMQLGLETEISGSLRTASGSDGCRKDIGLSEIDSNFLVLAGKIKRNIKPSKRKRKFDDVQSPVVSNKVVKRKLVRTKPFTRRMGTKISPLRNQASNGSCNFSQGDDSIKMFVNTWKEACRTNNVYEVFERMLEFYKKKKKAKVTALFSSFTFCGLLEVAVTSIKHWMWDSFYGKPQTVNQCELTSTGAENCTSHTERRLVCESGVTVGDIIGKISTYFEGDDNALSTASSHHEKFIFLLNKFRKLGSWLREQFSVTWLWRYLVFPGEKYAPV